MQTAFAPACLLEQRAAAPTPVLTFRAGPQRASAADPGALFSCISASLLRNTTALQKLLSDLGAGGGAPSLTGWVVSELSVVEVEATRSFPPQNFCRRGDGRSSVRGSHEPTRRLQLESGNPGSGGIREKLLLEAAEAQRRKASKCPPLSGPD